MRIIAILITISFLISSQNHHCKHYNKNSWNKVYYYNYSIKYFYNNDCCHLCSKIIDSYYLNGFKFFIIKVAHPLTQFERKRIIKKIRNHLGFLSNRVKFRFVI